jgi:hypothetical protein
MHIKDIINTDGVYIAFEKMHPSIWGFVYRDSFAEYHLIINKKLSHEKQKEIFMHEMTHINEHLPNKPYMVGLDMQHSEMEKAADLIAVQALEALEEEYLLEN